MYLGVFHVQFITHDGRVFSTKIMLLVYAFVMVGYMVWLHEFRRLTSQYVATILWHAILSPLMHGVRDTNMYVFPNFDIVCIVGL